MNYQKKEESGKLSFSFGDPAGIRTPDPQLRRLLLYPAELRDHHISQIRLQCCDPFSQIRVQCCD